MNNTGWAVVIIALIIILGGGLWWFSQATVAPATTDTTAGVNGANNTGNNNAGTGSNTDVGAGVDVNAGANAANTTTVRYSASGFSPSNITVPVGGAVNFINDTSGALWVAADEHPTHTEFDGTDRATHCSGSYAGATPFDQCQTGSSYTFVFTKAGTYEYHNHSAAQFGGTVVVQ